jgi:hypothetical protein
MELKDRIWRRKLKAVQIYVARGFRRFHISESTVGISVTLR